MREMPGVPTRESIESLRVKEGQGYDFKQRIDLETDRGKSKIIDDVVGFLNAGPGHLIIGVIEEGGSFKSFDALYGDEEAFCLRLTAVLQDNIDPRPLKIKVDTFALDKGFCSVVHIPWHGRRAFQNSLSGGFVLRTGPKNTKLLRDEVKALFTPEELFHSDALKLIEREDKQTTNRELMQGLGETLHIAIVPEEAYRSDIKPYHRGSASLYTVPHFHEGGDLLEGCQGGHETLEVTWKLNHINRLFLDDNWSFYSQTEHFIEAQNGGVNFHDFPKKLGAYFRGLEKFYQRNGIVGPFCVLMEIRNLQRNKKVGWAFPKVDSITFKPEIVDSLTDDRLPNFALAMLESKSRI